MSADGNVAKRDPQHRSSILANIDLPLGLHFSAHPKLTELGEEHRTLLG